MLLFVVSYTIESQVRLSFDKHAGDAGEFLPAVIGKLLDMGWTGAIVMAPYLFSIGVSSALSVLPVSILLRLF